MFYVIFAHITEGYRVFGSIERPPITCMNPDCKSVVPSPSYQQSIAKTKTCGKIPCIQWGARERKKKSKKTV